MNPKTVYNYIYLSFCLVAVIMSWTAVIVINGQAERLRDVVVEQEDRIQDLEMRLVIAVDRSDVGLILEYIMPQICVSELSKIAHNIRRMEEN